MKGRVLWNALMFLTAFLFISGIVRAQSPGLIVKPKNGVGGSVFLNPNRDKFSSKTDAGFVTNDVTESEIPYKIMPSIVPEPTGDQNGGTSDASTDFVKATDGSGFYAYYDGTYVMFRVRIGGKSNGARGYSILLDTDLKIGNNGFYGDPNYVPQTTQRSGNPGFELELLYAQGKGVQILNVDGTVTGTVLKTYPELTYAQTSVALSKNGSDADYFVDFGVPAADLGIGTQYIRMVASTCLSASSALNNNASDVWGVNDYPHKALIPNWTDIINAQCGVGITALSKDGPGICVCTPAPVVNSPVGPGTNVAVTGTWNRLSTLYSATTMLTLYKNGTAVSTITASSGATWSITVPALASGDSLWASAVSAPEMQCGTSNKISVGCSGTVALPTISCASDIGMRGTIPAGATVDLYEMSHSSNGGSLTPVKLPQSHFTYDNGSPRTFSYWGNNTQTGSPCSGGGQQLFATNYFLVVNSNGCLSAPLFLCVTGSSWNQPVQSGTMVINGPVYANQTSITGSGASTTGSQNKLYRLFVNGVYTAGTTSTTGSFSFSGLKFKTGDKLVVYEQLTNEVCQVFTPTVTVQCLQPPAPSIDNLNGEVYAGTMATISGLSSLPGATINLHRSSNPAGLVGTTTVNSAGEWAINGLSLNNNQTYYATQTWDGCTSVASASVNIVPITSNCPSISGTYTESAPAINGTFVTAFSGTLRLYNNGALIRTAVLSNATSWSVPVNSDNQNFTDVLTPKDTLSVTVEAINGGESAVCAFIVVACDVPPTPVAIPSAVTITQGETATFTLASTTGKVLYSLVDGNNLTYATSVFATGGAISITSYAFGKPGIYNLKIAADNMEAPECRTTQDVTVTVNNITLPLKYLNVAVKNSNALSKQITWTVTGEENILHYVVERSFDCTSFEAVATVGLQPSPDGTRQYSYSDVLPSAQKGVCYRIKAVGAGGVIVYSKVVSQTESKNLQALLVPNPAGAETTVYISSSREQVVQLQLMDLTGRPVLRKEAKVQEGRNSILLTGLEKYARGHYLLKVNTASEVVHLKLILE